MSYGEIRQQETKDDSQNTLRYVTHYDTLKVAPTATQEEIREAYRILANVWHPDRFSQGSKYVERANEKMKQINAAYEVLKDPQRRAEYDRRLQQQRGASRPQEPPPPRSTTQVQTKANPRDGAEIIYIPAGEFIMGSNDGSNDEKPQRRVYLDGYWIYKHPVTVKQYRRFCLDTGREMPEAPPWGWKDDHPIVNVTWVDAMAYCRWAGGSLPTEAQWEKAARGTDGRKYPWGNEWDPNRLRCSRSSRGDAGSTARVGSYPSGASPYGVLDMAGNVWQWCYDWYDENYYRTGLNRNPTGPPSGKERVLRGGGWYVSDPLGFRAAYRGRLDPTLRDSSHGFRCAVAGA